ncbi:MAG: TonB-dependent receptor [Flavobacteriales bacterium]|jgi:hemoglobin/transferrin/lactoferrin receptor protein|nr:TonB-dependent receptor [Flavobacteriales bacterium]
MHFPLFFRPLLLALLVLANSIYAQQVVVLDGNTRQPLEGATLNHAATSTSGITDPRGRADLGPFLPVDSIRFTRLGYHTLTLSPAQVTAADNRVALVPKVFPLGEFVVSAHRWEQACERVPDHITVVRPQDVAFSNPGTTADLLEQSGEVFMQRSQLGGGSPMLRGFAANRVLIVVDGVRMNNAIYRSGNLQNVISVDPEALERAEVLHGPGAMTYGSDAIGGVMDFHLLRPRFARDSSLLVRGGATARYATAAEAYTGHAHLGLGGRKLAFVGSVSFSRFGDLRTGSNGPEDYLRPWYASPISGRDSMLVNDEPERQVGSGYDALMALAKLAYRPLKGLEIGANLYYSTTTDIPRYDRLIELRPNGSPRRTEWYYGPQDWRMASVYVQHEAARGPWSKARFSIALQDYTESRNDRSFRSGTRRSQSEHVTGVWANLDLEKGLGVRTQLLYGAEFVTNAVGSQGITTNINTGAEQIINSRYPDGSTWSTGSVYAGVMHDATERLTLSAGLRGNTSALDCTFDTTLFPYPAVSTSLRNSAVTGNVGLAWRPDPTWKLSADLSTGFRAPNVDDIGKVFDSEPGAVIVPNPDLSPEYAYTGEVGIGKVFNDRARLRGGTFMLLLDKAMVRRPFTLNGQDSIPYDGAPSRVDAIVNAAQATVTGFYLAADIRLAKHLMLDLRYNWQQGEEQDDASTRNVPLRHAPPPFGRAGLTWERKALRVGASIRFSDGFTYDQLPPSEQGKTPIYAADAQGRPHAPAWHVIDLRAAYRIMPALLITAGVENITDQRYRPYSSGISAPGRNVVVALRATF